MIPTLTVEENLLLPLELSGRLDRSERRRALEVLDSVGLADRRASFPDVLSGGEQQRVAIARAVANRPALLLADEPTGNLDQATADIVFEELLTLARNQQLGALVATHNDGLARRMDRVVRLVDGRLVEG